MKDVKEPEGRIVLLRPHPVRIARPGGPRVVDDGLFDANVAELRDAYERALPELLGEAV